jgi:hypothetical protein
MFMEKWLNAIGKVNMNTQTDRSFCHSIVAQDHQATHPSREQVNLVGTLTNVAEQTLDGVGCPDIAAHRLRKLVKGQGVSLPLQPGSSPPLDRACHIRL